MATTELCWWVLPAWISPGAPLFLFFNILVGAIAVTSRELPASRRRLCRSTSSMVLERLRSFSMFPFHQAAEYSYHYHTSLEAAGQEQVKSQLASQRPLLPEPAAEALAVDVAASMPDPHKDEPESQENMSSSSDEENAQDQNEKHHTSERLGKKKPRNKVAAKNSKRRVRASGREAEDWLAEGKAELNARAELFIHQFREDLKLQRLKSIANYTRVLHRGGSAAPEHN
ncbi:hypothetical protein QOZ80_8AG0629080 [Eleusine coracana subsp. coracana]|nr:hypothetical protein QOZ80_8AG0629080 [Eleusine coracana subsp. coracana]